MAEDEIKKDYTMLMIAAIIMICAIAVCVRLVFFDDEETPYETVESEQERLFSECYDNYSRQSNRIKYFQCKDQIGIEEVYDNETGLTEYVPRYTTDQAALACQKDCFPVYYPGAWNCTFYQDTHNFTRLGIIPVNHDGFQNWTWRMYPTLYVVSLNDLTQIYNNWGANMTATCGYWIYTPYGEQRNISQEPCEDVGETREIYRGADWEDNYYCCIRWKDTDRNYCRNIPDTKEVLSCTCEANP